MIYWPIQVLDRHSGIGHIGAKGAAQNMGRSGRYREYKALCCFSFRYLLY